MWSLLEQFSNLLQTVSIIIKKWYGPTEAEDIKERWQEYTEVLCKEDLYDTENHDGMITDLEPDIMECEVKWALESITTNKSSGGDGIPAELFQTLKDDAMKVLHSICQKIWKTQQWLQDWKRSVFIPIPKKGSVTECSSYHTINKPTSCVLLLLLSCFSRVRLCATPQTAAHQAPLSLGFSRQGHWSVIPL